MPSINKYNEILSGLLADSSTTGDSAGVSFTEWDAYLREHCGLPGPRANLELALACRQPGDADPFPTLP